MEWSADILQGVIFPLPSARPPAALEVWKAISGGDEPESYHRQGAAPVAVSHASGPVNGSQVSVSAQMGRIELSIGPLPPVEMPTAPPKIDSLNNTLDLLRSCMTKAAHSIGTSRVSTIAQLSMDFADADQATKFLRSETGAPFPDNGIDTIFQFNVRKPYAVKPNYQMNRIFTWSSGLKQMISGQLGPDGSQMGFFPMVIIPIASLKLDFNSATAEDISQHAAAMLDEQLDQMVKAINGGFGSIT